MTEPVRRRRRVRSSAEPYVEPGATPPARPDAPVADEPSLWAPEPSAAGADAPAAERGLRALVGGGTSQVSLRAAMRARDVARPRPEDMARAEAELSIVRRHWSPRD
jgi:hypothetical protein